MEVLDKAKDEEKAKTCLAAVKEVAKIEHRGTEKQI